MSFSIIYFIRCAYQAKKWSVYSEANLADSY